MDHQTYANPLISRYCSQEMSYLFSSQKKFSTWRRLWLALAESEQQLGLDISDAQLGQMGKIWTKSTLTPPQPTKNACGTT